MKNHNVGKTTHGMRRTRFYRLYTGMRARCTNPNVDNYPNYGGRGILCKWNSFEEFRDDMLESYNLHVNEYGEKNTSIDRIDVNGNYHKDNCKRSTRKEQANNTTRNRMCTYNGETHTLQQWLDLLGVPRSSI